MQVPRALGYWSKIDKQHRGNVCGRHQTPKNEHRFMIHCSDLRTGKERSLDVA